MSTPYVDWLRRRGVPVFEGAGTTWRLYHGALVPTAAGPFFVEVTAKLARNLLAESGAWLVRFSSDPSSTPTEWWFIVCDRYDPAGLSANTRSKISRGRRRCTVERIAPGWLADHGYGCFVAAHHRYGGAEPEPEESWREQVLNTSDGPFEHWGVFVDGELAGYSRCLIEEHNVATIVVKLDPRFLKQYTSSALLSHLQETYVAGEGKTLSNGSRAVTHETQFQEFLVSHGYRRQFCRLNVIYRWPLGAAVSALYPFREAVRRIAGRGLPEQVRGVLLQEEWRRSTCRRPGEA
jgi:hypothetical protein